MERKTIEYIIQNFEKYVEGYDYNKYPKVKYNLAKKSFSTLDVSSAQIREILNWKYGNVGKSNTPQSHKNIIKRVIIKWPKFLQSESSKDAEDTFNWWHNALYVGKSRPYITVAFITHLIHFKRNIPIIDQHNYRAMNYLLNNRLNLNEVKKNPSTWQDIVELMKFIEKISALNNKKTSDEIDKFLMIYGKSIKNKL
jgi:hypothetical protein